MCYVTSLDRRENVEQISIFFYFFSLRYSIENELAEHFILFLFEEYRHFVIDTGISDAQSNSWRNIYFISMRELLHADCSSLVLIVNAFKRFNVMFKLLPMINKRLKWQETDTKIEFNFDDVLICGSTTNDHFKLSYFTAKFTWNKNRKKIRLTNTRQESRIQLLSQHNQAINVR